MDYKHCTKYLINKYKEVNNDFIDRFKIQKLLYFAHAIALVQLEKPLLDKNFEAWRHGPVYKDVYENFRNGKLYGFEDKINLEDEFKEIIDKVILKFKDCSVEYLVELSHKRPWIDIWNNFKKQSMISGYYCTEEMKNEAIFDYYSKHLEEIYDG